MFLSKYNIRKVAQENFRLYCWHVPLAPVIEVIRQIIINQYRKSENNVKKKHFAAFRLKIRERLMATHTKKIEILHNLISSLGLLIYTMKHMVLL